MGSGVLTNGRGVEDFGSAGGLTDHVHQHWFMLKVRKGLRKKRVRERRRKSDHFI